MTTESRRRRLAPVIALLLLAPWTAECSWGGFTLTAMPFVVLVLAPMYGGAALLIRETARRLGLGWPGIALLAAAFGVVQAGLVDQSLFNPHFLADTEFADSQAAANATVVPGLGFSARQFVDYVGNHVMLSICAPIAIIESYVGPQRRHRPWLGRPGLAVTVVAYLIGSLLIFTDEGGRKGFLASPAQLGFATLLALGLIGAAVLLRRRHDPAARPGHGTPGGRAPRPIWAGVVVLAAYLGVNLTAGGWPAVGVRILLATVAAALIIAGSRRAGWGERHVLAAWSAGVVGAAALAWAGPNYAPASPAEAVVGDLAVSVIAVSLIGGACWRLRRRTTVPSTDG